MSTNYIVTDCQLTDSEKLQMIKLLADCYFNTDQDTEKFASEFFYVVHEILQGRAPIKLEFLTDFEDTLATAIPAYVEIYEEFYKQNFVYDYIPGGGDNPTLIFRQDIEREIEDFLDRSDAFYDIPYDRQEKLKERLYAMVVSLGFCSHYHPSTYLDSMEDDDIRVIKQDVML
jgi:hypothetical protein